MKIINIWVAQMKNVLGICVIILMITSLSGNFILGYFDFLNPDQIELIAKYSEMETENETENETGEVDEYDQVFHQNRYFDQNRINFVRGYFSNLRYRHFDVVTPPPEHI